MDKLKLDIQRFAPDPPISGNLIDEECLYEYHQNIERDYAPKTITGTLSNLTTTDKTDLVSAINEVNGKVSRYIIGLRMSANQSMTGTSDTVIKVDTIDYQIGNKFSLNTSTNEITIGSGVNHILVSASVVVGQFTTNGLRRLFAKKNNTNFARAFTYYNQQYMNSLVIPPKLIAVSPGDKIKFSMTNAGNSTVAGTDVDSWFTLEVID